MIKLSASLGSVEAVVVDDVAELWLGSEMLHRCRFRGGQIETEVDPCELGLSESLLVALEADLEVEILARDEDEVGACEDVHPAVLESMRWRVAGFVPGRAA